MIRTFCSRIIIVIIDQLIFMLWIKGHFQVHNNNLPCRVNSSKCKCKVYSTWESILMRTFRCQSIRHHRSIIRLQNKWIKITRCRNSNSSSNNSNSGMISSNSNNSSSLAREILILTSISRTHSHSRLKRKQIWKINRDNFRITIMSSSSRLPDNNSNSMEWFLKEKRWDIMKELSQCKINSSSSRTFTTMKTSQSSSIQAILKTLCQRMKYSTIRNETASMIKAMVNSTTCISRMIKGLTSFRIKVTETTTCSENEQLVVYPSLNWFLTWLCKHKDSRLSSIWHLNRSTSKTTTTWESTSSRRSLLKRNLVYQIWCQLISKDLKIRSRSCRTNLSNSTSLSSNFSKPNKQNKLKSKSRSKHKPSCKKHRKQRRQTQLKTPHHSISQIQILTNHKVQTSMIKTLNKRLLMKMWMYNKLSLTLNMMRLLTIHWHHRICQR